MFIFFCLPIYLNKNINMEDEKKQEERDVNSFVVLTKLIMDYYTVKRNPNLYGTLKIDSELQAFLQDNEKESEESGLIPGDLDLEIKIAFKNQIKKYQN